LSTVGGDAEDLLKVAVQQFMDLVRHGHLRLSLRPHNFGWLRFQQERTTAIVAGMSMANLPDFEGLAMFANVATVRSLALAAQAAASR
jgi:hypothetical protein